MEYLFSIMLGGAVGAALRYGTVLGVNHLLGRGLPYGTLTVNVLGSFLIGVLMIWFSQRALLETPLAKGLIIGVLGAFTTFSTFSFDNFVLLEQGDWLSLTGNILLNVALCLLAVYLGVLVARSF
ncbi:MAG: fluoride efflux transporter CrcB [Thiolinea sp.]